MPPQTLKPDVRLAYNPGPSGAIQKGLEAPTVRLAINGKAQGETNGSLKHSDKRPALLVSYYYLSQFLERRDRYDFRDWVLDSGAYSAHNSGVTIEIDEYITECKRLLEEDSTLKEIYSLDVIGDWRASLKNTEKMHRAGVPAIPCFHYGEPWDVLTGLARDYPKIALGGVAARSVKGKLDWAKQCFARVWPHKIHGFALCSERAVMSLPFHSVDATSWEIGPCKYGRWRTYGKMSVRGSKQNLRAEVEWYLDLERRAQERWKREMALLETSGPSVRLAVSSSRPMATDAALSENTT